MTTSPKLLWASGLAIVFFVAHAALLPATPEDIDSLNFVLGLHDFDPTRHQPHPPGYPVFMALGKIARAVVPSDAAALAVLGAVFGALAVFPLMKLFENLETLDPGSQSSRLPPGLTLALATLMVLASPLYWFSALRPLSDVPGLALILAAQAALLTAFVRQRMNPDGAPDAQGVSGRMVVLGAFLSALAIGMRSQAVWLTVPLLMLVLVQRARRSGVGALVGSVMAFAAGLLAWAVPLVVATGGLMKYRAALSGQSAEQFTGLDILLSNPTPRRFALGLVAALIGPWAVTALGCVVVALAFLGFVMLLLRAPRAAGLLMVVVLPYAIFHIVVQETYSRYALPLVPALAYLAVRGLAVFGRTMAVWGTAVMVVASLVVTLPASRAYARSPAPAFAALRDLHALLDQTPGVIGMHQGLARAVETESFGATPILKAPPMREAPELAAYWLNGGHSPVWYLADPARTDLELVDPLSRRLYERYRWTFERQRFMGGVRPDIVDLVRIDSPPGYFLEDGWHLTSETLNWSERRGRSEGVGHIRARPGAALVVIGGESTSPAGGEPAHVSLAIENRTIDQWEVPAGGSFFRRIRLEPGALASRLPFSRLVASYRTPDGRPGKVRLTQFVLASPDELFAVQHAGWNELEYNGTVQRRWRWTTGRAMTFVNSGGTDVVLKISGESPLKNFDSAPRIVVRAGDRVLATASPVSDFELEVPVPAAVLAAADGMIAIETDRTFVPNERSGSPDKRTLGLGVFTFEVFSPDRAASFPPAYRSPPR